MGQLGAPAKPDDGEQPEAPHLGEILFDLGVLAQRLGARDEPAATHAAQLLGALVSALASKDPGAPAAINSAAKSLHVAVGRAPSVPDPDTLGPVAERLRDALAAALPREPDDAATLLGRWAAYLPGGRRVFPGEVTARRIELWARAIKRIKVTDDRKAYARSVIVECARADGMTRPADRLFGAEGTRQRRALQKRRARK